MLYLNNILFGEAKGSDFRHPVVIKPQEYLESFPLATYSPWSQHTCHFIPSSYEDQDFPLKQRPMDSIVRAQVFTESST